MIGSKTIILRPGVSLPWFHNLPLWTLWRIMDRYRSDWTYLNSWLHKMYMGCNEMVIKKPAFSTVFLLPISIRVHSPNFFPKKGRVWWQHLISKLNFFMFVPIYSLRMVIRAFCPLILVVMCPIRVEEAYELEHPFTEVELVYVVSSLGILFKWYCNTTWGWWDFNPGPLILRCQLSCAVSSLGVSKSPNPNGFPIEFFKFF